MARVVLTNASVVFGSTDLSDHIASITLNSTYDIVETTAFGNTAKTRVAGLADNSVTFEFHQDYATSSVEQTIYPLLGTAVSVVAKPVAGTTTTINPQYTFSALVAGFLGSSSGIPASTLPTKSAPTSAALV